MLHSTPVTVKPGELYPFSITDVEISFADGATAIVVDIGNPFEIAMR